jgi:hypothetical protein
MSTSPEEVPAGFETVTDVDAAACPLAAERSDGAVAADGDPVLAANVRTTSNRTAAAIRMPVCEVLVGLSGLGS